MLQELINYELLEKNLPSLNKEWNSRKPFRYIVFENFFKNDVAERIHGQFPSIKSGGWDYTTYSHQNNKFVMTKFTDPLFQQVFQELNSKKLLNLLEGITSISPLISDQKLFGGGLHQSSNGAFLNVHVDFNYHSETKHHRRMNLIVYMNKNWKEEYNGYLELWDMKEKKRIEYVEPSFNRCVIFETNEVSFHGHPKPLNTPEDVTRKSLAVYYYTEHRPAEEIQKEHNTIYINTEGAKGIMKFLTNSFKALIERLKNK